MIPDAEGMPAVCHLVAYAATQILVVMLMKLKQLNVIRRRLDQILTSGAGEAAKAGAHETAYSHSQLCILT